jgi:hypothetical protein
MTEIVELSPRIRIDGALHGVWRGRRLSLTWGVSGNANFEFGGGCMQISQMS